MPDAPRMKYDPNKAIAEQLEHAAVRDLRAWIAEARKERDTAPPEYAGSFALRLRLLAEELHRRAARLYEMRRDHRNPQIDLSLE